MKIHEQYIIEWKGISDEVEKMSNDICSFLWDTSKKEKPFIDKVLNKPVICGEFKFNISDYCKDLKIDEIVVRYKIIFFDDRDEYNKNYYLIGNSEYSNENNILTINVGSIGGVFDYSVIGEVYHELCHSLQYGKGMEKRENLYDNTIKLIGENSILEKTIGKILYYTFSHEQDAFAHQFYAFLNKGGESDNFYYSSLNFQNYRDFLNSIGEYDKLKNKNTDDINSILKSIGLTIEQFNLRMHFGAKRFKKKLYRVYQRYIWEKNNSHDGIKENTRKMENQYYILKEYRKRYKDIEYDKNIEYLW